MKSHNKYIIIFIIAICFFNIKTNAQNYEEYIVDEFYKKIDLGYGTLDENGQPINHIFIETDLDEGVYEISISDGPGELYEIMGTELFIKFVGYYGYAGYGEEGILKVETGYNASVFYKKE